MLKVLNLHMHQGMLAFERDGWSAWPMATRIVYRQDAASQFRDFKVLKSKGGNDNNGGGDDGADGADVGGLDMGELHGSNLYQR